MFANELCDLFQNHQTSEVTAAVSALIKRFAPVVTLDDEYTFKLVNAAYEKLKEFSAIFEIDVQASNYCRSIEQWLTYDEDEGPEWSPGEEV